MTSVKLPSEPTNFIFPSSLLKEYVIFTDVPGVYPSALIIFSFFTENVILLFSESKIKSTLSPSKLKDYKIHNDPVGINGDLVEGRIMMDTFVLEQKKKGVVALVTA